MTTTTAPGDAALLSEPALSKLPTFLELAPRSKWLAGMPGLLDATMRWERELPAERDRLDETARMLSRPTLHPSGFKTMGLMVGRSANAAGHYFAELPAGLWRRAVYGQRFNPGSERMLEHVGDVVRKSGPSMVKLGQFIATAQGILPDPLVRSFAWCRDSVPPMERSVMRRVITEELGAPPETIFAEFDDEPMAAASIAQAHRATTRDGRKVVVKVQRPNLEDQFTRDLRAMALLAYVLEKGSATVRLANLPGFCELFASLVLQEIDFRMEACNMVELGLAAEHAEADFVVFPRPLPELVTPRVIVMEHLDGVPYTEAEWGSLDDAARNRVLRLVIAGVIEHTLVYGVFHGDLHAGNVLATPDGILGLVDYGIVGRLDLQQRASLVQFLVAFAGNDTRGQLAAMTAFGAVPPEADIDAMAAKIEAQIPYIESVTQDRLAETLGAVLRVLASEGFRLPTPLVLFFKNLLYLNGFAAAVAPGVDLLGEIAPIFEYFRSKYGEEMEFVAGPLPDHAGWK